MIGISTLATFAMLLATAFAQERRAIALVVNPPTAQGYAVNGSVSFSQSKPGEPVLVEGVITGLKVNALHGFHIHEKGDISTKGCLSTGGHFNPQRKVHGGPNDRERHIGDLGNIRSDENGIAVIRILDSMISLEGENNILGRAVVVHEGEDDLGKGIGELEKGSKATGNAGGRLACGVVGLQHPVEPWSSSSVPAATHAVPLAMLVALSAALLL